MSKPSYWALFINNTAIFRLLNRHLLQCFLMEPSLKSFSSLQMLNRLNSGERKAGGKRERVLGRYGKDPLAPFPLSSPTLLCACHAGYIPSQYFQWCIHWYIPQANSHVMYWLFWQHLKQSGWNLPVFPYYALPSKDLRPMNIKLKASLYPICCL